MAHTFLQEISGCLLLSFYLTTSFKYKFVLIPLDFKAFLFFFFFNPKERLTVGYFGSSQHMTPTMSLLSLSDTGRTVSTSVSLLEQKLHKYSDVWSPFSLPRPQHWEQRLIPTSHLVNSVEWIDDLLLLFCCSAMFDSLRPHGLQHARPPCPSPTPGVIQTHVHWVGDAIQPSHPLLSPSPPAFNLSQH